MKDIICVIPARGGSKRAYRKNIAPLCGKPMLAWTIEAAHEAGLDPIVSSEDQEILDVAKQYGASHLQRPLHIASDSASTESVLIHALDTFGLDHQWVCCLPPTSPVRTAQEIMMVLDHDRPEDIDCLMTVTEYRGDLWEQQGDLICRMQQNAPRRQQERKPFYEENSAVYLTRSKSLWMSQKITGYGNVIGIPIDKAAGFDVNDELDLKIADTLLTIQQRQPLRVLLST